MWAGFEGTLTPDGLAACNAMTGADHPFDRVHGNRWLQQGEAAYGIEPGGFRREDPPRSTRAGDPPTEFLEFAAGVRARWRAEVAWVELHLRAATAAREWRYRRAIRSMGRFLAREGKDTDAARIADELGRRLRRPFPFVRTPGGSWHANEAEREVRWRSCTARSRTGEGRDDGVPGSRRRPTGTIPRRTPWATGPVPRRRWAVQVLFAESSSPLLLGRAPGTTVGPRMARRSWGPACTFVPGRGEAGSAPWQPTQRLMPGADCRLR